MKAINFFISKMKYFLPLLFVCACSSSEVKEPSDLREIFLNPPQDAKPRGYWIWPHGNFDYSRITEELREFNEKGLGGVDIYDMGISDPYDIIPSGNAFLSDQMMDGIEFALKEAARLDLAMGLSVSNGWNAGGDWTKPDEMIMRLLFSKDTLKGPVTLNTIGFPEIPRKFEKPYGTFDLFPQFDEDGFPVYYENVALIAYPLSQNNLVSDLKKIIYLDPDKIEGNAVDISLPEGDWVLVRAVVTPLGQKMWVRSDRSNGFIMDHYSVKATKNHFNHVIGRLEDRMGNLKETALERLYLASFEAEDYIIWSPELKETFQTHHGYEMDPYIPALAGLTVVDKETTRRFLYDYRLTVSEMFVNNHYRQARDISNEHGLLLASESGGPGPPLHYVPTEDLKALGSVDVMRGEFWNRTPQHFDKFGNDLTYVVKNIASAAHIYGHKIVEMEAFTSHGKHWQERPIELKKLADEAYCTGMTRVVYHTMPHSPREAGIPGWSYSAGTHISPKMTWWELSKSFHSYFARTSALLQHGDFAADVVYYYGEEIPNFAIGVKYIRPGLGKGYDYDDLNKEILLKSTVTDDGQVLLPSGMKYHLLVLPDQAEMSLEVLKKIEELLKNGASILGNKPSKVPGLKDYQNREKALNELANKIWGKPGRETVRNAGENKGENTGGKYSRNYGKGTIYVGYSEREILTNSGILPDVQFWSASDEKVNLDYIHRYNDKDDIYFIANKDSAGVEAIADFRISDKQPYAFDPVDGSTSKIAFYYQQDGRTNIPLHFEKYGSVFIVFSEESEKIPHIVSIEKDGHLIFPLNILDKIDLSYKSNNEIVFSSGLKGKYVLIFSNGKMMEINCRNDEAYQVLTKGWDVYFSGGWGFDPIQKFDSLMDWTRHPDKELSIFSGIATYKKTFRIAAEDLGKDLSRIQADDSGKGRSETRGDNLGKGRSGTQGDDLGKNRAMIHGDDLEKDRSWILDLGRVGEVVRVYLNGQEVATRVFPPYNIEIGEYLKAGENYLVIEVVNTWLNQLIGEKDKPFDEQRTRSNVGRGTKEDVRRLWEDYEPQPSGLIGPVRIIQKQNIIVEFQ